MGAYQPVNAYTGLNSTGCRFILGSLRKHLSPIPKLPCWPGEFGWMEAVTWLPRRQSPQELETETKPRLECAIPYFIGYIPEGSGAVVNTHNRSTGIIDS